MIEIIKYIVDDSPIGWIMLLILSIIIAIIIGLLVISCDYIFGFNRDVSVIVVDKMYTPSKCGSGVATGITSNGKVGASIISICESEKFTLLVRDKSGKGFTHDVNITEYINIKTGEEIVITLRVGRFSKKEYH